MQITSTDPPTNAPTGCCPPFEPAAWHDREVVWRDRLFVHEHVRDFVHIPLNFRRKVSAAMAKIDAAGAAATPNLMLSEATSLWGSELYIDVTKPVPGADMVALSGTFLTRVYDGPFKDAGKWARDMKRHVSSTGRALDKLYFAYTTCPKCAKRYGHNYVVLFARIADAA